VVRQIAVKAGLFKVDKSDVWDEQRM
jgi:hypothetical protein